MIDHEYSRAVANLAWLQPRGVQFLRCFGEVGGATWADRVIDPRTEGWLAQIRNSMILAKDSGLRIMWTLFAGGVLTHEREWSDATDRFIDAARPYVNTVQLVEIKNESNGPPIDILDVSSGPERGRAWIPNHPTNQARVVQRTGLLGEH
jgi:hypothetical protein